MRSPSCRELTNSARMSGSDQSRVRRQDYLEISPATLGRHHRHDHLVIMHSLCRRHFLSRSLQCDLVMLSSSCLRRNSLRRSLQLDLAVLSASCHEVIGTIGIDFL